jgi:hypothetical protein
MSADAAVMIGVWIFIAVLALGVCAYAEWREEMDAMLLERARRRAKWHSWWYEDGDKPLTSGKPRQYHQGRKGAI